MEKKKKLDFLPDFRFTRFSKGVYEKNLKERLSKQYMTQMAQKYWVPTVELMKRKMGIGG